MRALLYSNARPTPLPLQRTHAPRQLLVDYNALWYASSRPARALAWLRNARKREPPATPTAPPAAATTATMRTSIGGAPALNAGEVPGEGPDAAQLSAAAHGGATAVELDDSRQVAFDDSRQDAKWERGALMQRAVAAWRDPRTARWLGRHDVRSKL